MFPYITITEQLQLPTYLVIISLAYCLCILWVYKRAIAEQKSIGLALDLCLVIMGAGFLGARLVHVLYENPGYYSMDPAAVFKVWQGGFVFYGGALTAALASWLFLRFKKESFWPWADFMAPVVALGYAIGRFGCFLNGCCFGKECGLPWAIDFNRIGLPSGLRHPTQLYAVVGELLILVLLLQLKKSGLRGKPLPAGALFLIWLVFHSLNRLVMEYFREDFRGPELILSISSWLSLGILVAAAALLVKRLYFKSEHI